ncbi:unnamed protein product [Urochloa decumbens]|uniref:Bifunctional inhibitor/plant lipid transfer protein/seed storage helical domain-containing protein n=1 Tax=Urochloa decumbens TaxID=240449 RepID=A0ABC9B4V8_9POAL
MFPGRLAILILLLCATATSYPHLVTGNRNPNCTKEQKANILLHCIAYTERGTPPISVHPESVCCAAVKVVPNMEMRCIVGLLDGDEKKKYDVHRILALKIICGQRSPPAPKQNKIMV